MGEKQGPVGLDQDMSGLSTSTNSMISNIFKLEMSKICGYNPERSKILSHSLVNTTSSPAYLHRDAYMFRNVQDLHETMPRCLRCPLGIAEFG